MILGLTGAITGAVTGVIYSEDYEESIACFGQVGWSCEETLDHLTSYAFLFAFPQAWQLAFEFLFINA